MSKTKSQIAFRIDSAKIERFKEKAKQEGKSQTAIIDQLIANYLEGSEEPKESAKAEESPVKKSQMDEMERRLSYLEECFFTKSNTVANDSKAVEEEEVANDSKAVKEDSKEVEEVEEEDKYEKEGDWFPDNELFRMVVEKEKEPDIEILWGKHVNHFHNYCHHRNDDGYLVDLDVIDNNGEFEDAYCFPPTKENIEKKRKRNEGHGVAPETIVERIRGLESVEMLFNLLGEESEFKYAREEDPERRRISQDLNNGYWYDRDLERFFRYNNVTNVVRLKDPTPIVRGERYQT